MRTNPNALQPNWIDRDERGCQTTGTSDPQTILKLTRLRSLSTSPPQPQYPNENRVTATLGSSRVTLVEIERYIASGAPTVQVPTQPRKAGPAPFTEVEKARASLAASRQLTTRSTGTVVVDSADRRLRAASAYGRLEREEHPRN
jgi:hypothetical protein